MLTKNNNPTPKEGSLPAGKSVESCQTVEPTTKCPGNAARFISNSRFYSPHLSHQDLLLFRSLQLLFKFPRIVGIFNLRHARFMQVGGKENSSEDPDSAIKLTWHGIIGSRYGGLVVR